ncbi:DUF927 domain-containing protein, partial [Phytobacter diazotrophicus]|uniref:DUF927 domain-containing protein n=1 Tax=Phytobacter diazotrophicus TaxID=395631 RepID=UPI0030766D4D
MKNAPNVKYLPKDKFTEAIIFAGADAFAHAQHWTESEGKKAGDDVPPVYLDKKQLVELESLRIVDRDRQCVRVIRAGEIGEKHLTLIATKLAFAGVKSARLFNGMYEKDPAEEWTEQLSRLKAEAENGNSTVVSLPVANLRDKKPGDELKPRVESRDDGVFWITPKVDRESGERIHQEMWLCSPLVVVGAGSDGAERYLVLRWKMQNRNEDVTRAIPCADIGERDGWRTLKAGGVNVTTKSTGRAILADWLQQSGTGQEWRISHTSGWHHGAYIMPDGEVIGEPETPILFNGRSAAAGGYAIAGTPESWRDTVARLCTGNPSMMLGVAASLA